jgi:hypothetical protein
MLPERTQVPEPRDWLKRGHDPMEVVRQGGGGSALDGLQAARTRVGGRESFNDAKTKIAAIRTSPPEGVNGDALSHWGDDHLFEFKADDGTLFEARVSYNHRYPEEVIVESIHPKTMLGGDYIAEGQKHANKMGSRAMLQLAGELRRAFPKTNKLFAQRASGWNPGRDMEMRLPEVTQHGAPQFETQVVKRPQDLLPEPRQRQLVSNEGHGPYKDWPETEPTATDHMPRGEYEGGDDLLDEATAALDMGDVVRQGRVEAGGGGTSAFGDSFAAAPTRLDRTLPSARNLRGEVAGREPELLPDMEDVTQAGAPRFPMEAPQRFDVLAPKPARRPGVDLEGAGERRRPAMSPEEAAEVDEMLARRRAAGAEAQIGAGTPPRPSTGEGTRGMGPAGAPAAPAPSEATRAVQVPEVRRPAPQPIERPRVIDRGGQTRLGQAPLDVRLQARPSAAEMAAQREKGALLQVGMAGYEGARRAHNFVAAPIGALVGITKEAMKNPAARARAISLFKLERLAAVRPDVWARVGASLKQAQEKGPERYDAARHAFLLRDPEFRQAEAEVTKELEGLDDEALVERLSGSRRSSPGGR